MTPSPVNRGLAQLGLALESDIERVGVRLLALHPKNTTETHVSLDIQRIRRGTRNIFVAMQLCEVCRRHAFLGVHVKEREVARSCVVVHQAKVLYVIHVLPDEAAEIRDCHECRHRKDAYLTAAISC